MFCHKLLKLLCQICLYFKFTFIHLHLIIYIYFISKFSTYTQYQFQLICKLSKLLFSTYIFIVFSILWFILCIAQFWWTFNMLVQFVFHPNKFLNHLEFNMTDLRPVAMICDIHCVSSRTFSYVLISTHRINCPWTEDVDNLYNKLILNFVHIEE